MTKKTRISVVPSIALILGTLGTITDVAAVTGIISYHANQNPTNVDAYVTQPGNQFWSGPNSFGAGPVGTGINDGGTLAWSVARGSVGAGEELWRVGSGTPVAIDPADIAIGNTEGWKLNARLRLPESGRAASAGAQVDYADGAKAWAMIFGTDADGDPIVALVDGTPTPASFTLEGAGNGAYHEYLLAYNPLESNADPGEQMQAVTDARTDPFEHLRDRAPAAA